jgi:hypothetical protein
VAVGAQEQPVPEWSGGWWCKGQRLRSRETCSRRSSPVSGRCHRCPHDLGAASPSWGQPREKTPLLQACSARWSFRLRSELWRTRRRLQALQGTHAARSLMAAAQQDVHSPAHSPLGGSLLLPPAVRGGASPGGCEVGYMPQRRSLPRRLAPAIALRDPQLAEERVNDLVELALLT